MKYICFDNGLYDEIVMFVDSNDHKQFAMRLNLKDEAIISAGFVTFYSDGPECFGQSVSLNKKCRDIIDTNLLVRYLES